MHTPPGNNVIARNIELRPIAEALADLRTDGNGLTTAEALTRRGRFGANILPEPRRPGTLALIVEELRNPLLLILAAAAVIAALVGERVDGVVILGALIITAGFGIGMAARAERALHALRSMVQPMARVVRDGREVEIAMTELVPGDRIVLARGMRIPADARLLAVEELEIDESALTGESLPVMKQASSPESEISPLKADAHLEQNLKSDALWQGTTVVEGSAVAVVTATGSQTRLAAIAQSLVQPREHTPLQEELGQFTRMIAIIILALAALLFGVGIFRGESPGEMLALSVAVAVAAIPEGLAVAVTVILAIGAVHLSRRRCLVRRLVAAETLGSVSVILTDKTGTLTEGRMRVTGVRTSECLFELPRDRAQEIVVRILENAVLGTDVVIVNPDAPPEAWEFLGHSTEAGIVVAAGVAGLDVANIRAAAQRIDRVPFSADRKYSATLVERESRQPQALLRQGFAGQSDSRKPMERAIILVGAPERIVAARALPDAEWREFEALGGEGFRLIGVAEVDVPITTEHIEDAADVPTRARMLGVLLLRDTLRPDAALALQEARTAGIRTVMVTGDHPATAARIARDLGMGERVSVLSGSELAALSDADLATRVANIDVFARMAPEQKLRLVRAWRERGAVVAVTGDGVNDAPALVGADVGVAMGSGTDVAREASDLVLLDDRYETIIAGVAGGRMIWDNLRKTVSYLLLSSFSEVVLVGGAIAIGMPIPIVPAQILWVNLLEDTFPAAALAFEPLERGAMREPPRVRTTPLFGRDARALVFGVGLVSDVLLLATAYAVFTLTGDLALTRTIVFGGLGINALLFIFGIRDLRRPIWRSHPFENRWLLIAVAVSLAILILGLAAPFLRTLLRTVPLPAWGWGIIAVLGILELLAVEVVKIVTRRRNHAV